MKAFLCKNWSIVVQGWQESNSRRAALETTALPLSYSPIFFFVQPISLILCLKQDISSKELIFDLALLLRGSLHWEVVYPSNSNLLNWVEVSKSDLLSSRCIFRWMNQLVFVSVALSFELSLSSIREMSPFFQCQDFPNSGYPKLCALVERCRIYKNQIFFQGLLWLFYCFFNSLDFFPKNTICINQCIDIFRFPNSTELI